MSYQIYRTQEDGVSFCMQFANEGVSRLEVHLAHMTVDHLRTFNLTQAMDAAKQEIGLAHQVPQPFSRIVLRSIYTGGILKTPVFEFVSKNAEKTVSIVDAQTGVVYKEADVTRYNNNIENKKFVAANPDKYIPKVSESLLLLNL